MKSIKGLLEWIKQFFIGIGVLLFMLSLWFIALPYATGKLDQYLILYIQFFLDLKDMLMVVYRPH
ncbi:hypothetical protein PaeCFBP13512_22135 [Paenibacillus sp. CFBP13512]|uniref:hypothetical protein n=1 Tax=Paenibacillus sp. CFBP13512 TaxID=2184007 RepID=UPI0010C0A6DC|nr:hypothetical protein [Paenibacillus sp. CFBP13512]TKJ83822.1 hypothetical protein PaeCFBP13512_22135 [Paenibacillus sp. CFBP13512]